MDRLEMALEKSKQQRAALNPGQAMMQGLAASGGAIGLQNENETPSSGLDEENLEANRIVAHLTRSIEADVYRQLRTKVLQTMRASGFKTLAITSPHYGDGKTTVALNLGISIALDIKQTVLLVDLDLRKPALHRYLGIDPQAGLTDFLLNDTPLHECLTRPSFERVSLLPVVAPFDNSSEILGSPKMIGLAHELKARYPDRLVIYDMPPVLTQDDPLAFLPQTDAVLVVMRDGVTKIDDVKRCLETLKGANVIGTVLNDCW